MQYHFEKYKKQRKELDYHFLILPALSLYSSP